MLSSVKSGGAGLSVSKEEAATNFLKSNFGNTSCSRPLATVTPGKFVST